MLQIIASTFVRTHINPHAFTLYSAFRDHSSHFSFPDKTYMKSRFVESTISIVFNMNDFDFSNNIVCSSDTAL